MAVQRNTVRTSNAQLDGAPVKKMNNRSRAWKFQTRGSGEKEDRALSRIAAVLQAMCLLLVFGTSDALAKSSKSDRRGPVMLSVVVQGEGQVMSRPDGLSCNDRECTGEFPWGTRVRLIAQPGEGQILSRWRGACGGSKKQCRVRLRSPKRVLATFQPPPMIPLKVILRGGGTVSSVPEGIKCGEEMCSGEFPHGMVVRLTAEPQEGQVLARWRGACGGSREQCRVRMRNPKRVLARFRPIPLIPIRVFLRGEGTVSSMPEGLECSDRICRGRFPQGSLVTLHAEPGENQSFNRWRGACRGTEECVVNMRRPRNVLARFVANPPAETMALTVAIKGLGSVVSEPDLLKCEGVACKGEFPVGMVVTLTPMPGEKQKFSEWGGACSEQGLEACSVKMDTSLEVTAAFVPPDIPLTVNIINQGSVVSKPEGIDCNAGTCIGGFATGTMVELSQTPGEGHEFGGWTGACTGKESCIVNLTAPMEVTATFVLLPPPTVNLTVMIAGEGSVTSNPQGIVCPPTESCAFGFESETPVILTATPADGHTFSGWSDESCPRTGQCTVTFAEATTITATFEPVFDLTVRIAGDGSVISVPPGIDCFSTAPTENCTFGFRSNTQVTLTATPDAGHDFSAWSDASCGETSTCSLTLAAATTITATFVPSTPGGLTDAEAIRFLEQSTWGPNSASIAHLQSMGKTDFLAEQFNAAPSTYPDPVDDSNSLGPLYDQWFHNAFHGQDQLRQRVAFALGQLFVVSSHSVGSDDQMIPYQRMLMNNAFGNFYDLMRDVTLSPTMGRYLDMVNNDKTQPGSGLNPNENYARELLQLFSVGLKVLNLDGSDVVDASGQPIPTYDQDVIINFARVYTGWTYPTRPGETLRWRNPSHYAGPMEAVEEHHDTEQKVLMNGFVILAGGTAQEDLNSALFHIFEHQNVAPFVATRLIRHLVTSNPSPEYIQRVATVFNGDQAGVRGNMQAVITAILMDPEAATVIPNSGHLREPILYAVALLRALNADAQLDNPLFTRTRDMGQPLFGAPHVFNFFSPLYNIPGTNLFGPEYEIHTLTNAIARANFVNRVVNNQIGVGVTVELLAFEAVAADVGQLVAAVERALLHDNLSGTERQSIITAVSVSDNPRTRARTAVYLVATSAKYQVQH